MSSTSPRVRFAHMVANVPGMRGRGVAGATVRHHETKPACIINVRAVRQVMKDGTFGQGGARLVQPYAL